MESSVIVSVVMAALQAGAGEAAKSAVKDGYIALKDGLGNLLPDNKETMEALESLEANPDSDARKAVFEEELERADISDYSAIRLLVGQLLKTMEQMSAPDQKAAKYLNEANASISGIQGDSHSFNAPVTFNINPSQKKSLNDDS